VDSQAPVGLLDKDNDTRRVESVRWGAVAGIDNGTRGSIYGVGR
jgi:hypothetical protein